MKDILPLLSTVVGALLALAGVSVQQTLSARRERKIAIRRKLDELALLSEELVYWANEDFNSMYNIALNAKQDDVVARTELKKRISAINRIVTLYHEDLKHESDKFLRVAKEYDDKRISFTISLVESKKFNAEAYSQEVRPLIDNLVEAENLFLKCIGTSISKVTC